MTIYDPDIFSFAKADYPWPSAGQVGVLIDASLDPELLQDMSQPEPDAYKQTIQTLRQGPIDPRYIRGLVMNEKLIKLHNPKKTIKTTIPTPERKVVTRSTPLPFDFDKDDYIQILKTRLKRLLGTTWEDNLVPVYTHDGKMIWPENKQ